MKPLHRRAFAQGLAGLAVSAAARGGAGALETVLNPPGGPPMASAGVIARRGDGKLLFQAAAGLAFGPAGPRPFALDQPFRVASISKMAAASVFLPIALLNGVKLNEDASDLVGFRLRHPAHPDVPITPRMILSHTSALRNGKSYPVPLGHRLEEAFLPGGRHYDDGAWFGPAEHRPGDWFAYADVNFALVAQMLEKLTCDRFDIAMRDALFRPLGLDIGYNWSGVAAPSARGPRRACIASTASGSRRSTAAVPPAPKIAFTRPADRPGIDVEDYRPGENGFAFSPQGGLRLSLDDMDRLARLYAGHGTAAASTSSLTRGWRDGAAGLDLRPGAPQRRDRRRPAAGLWPGLRDPAGPAGPRRRQLLRRRTPPTGAATSATPTAGSPACSGTAGTTAPSSTPSTACRRPIGRRRGTPA